MKVLLYMKGWEDREASLSRVLRQAVSGLSLETCHQPDHLERLVSRPGQDWAAVVAAVGTPAALRELEPWKEQLSPLGLLLILPSQDEPFMALGHRLAPRFLAGGDDAHLLVSRVLERIISNRVCRADAKLAQSPGNIN